jgi:hypothetical protein
MKRVQIILSRCTICHEVYACYDSNRFPSKKNCKECREVCPNPTQPDSHGFCSKHFQEHMTQLRERIKKSEVNDANEEG